MVEYDGIPSLALINDTLSELFAIRRVDSVHQLKGGHLCRSFTVKTDQGVFFLKQYRHRISQRISQIKNAEKHFATKGLPVMIPMSDRYNRSAFLMGKNWYSLFKFVDLKNKRAHELTTKDYQLLGKELALLHKAGKDIGKDVATLTLWSKERFALEVAEVERELSRRPKLNRIEQMIQEMIETKRRIIEKNIFSLQQQALVFDTLLHGDFSYQNVFFSHDGEEIESIYDFEKAARGPREFELARAMFVNCFDEAWEEENVQQAAEFLKAYQHEYPTSFEAFQAGVHMYVGNITHQTWIEVKVLVRNAYQYVDLLEIHARKIAHLEQGFDPLIERIFP